MPKSKSVNTTPAIDSVPFLHVNKHGDMILDIQVIPNASKTQVDGLYGAPDPIALKIRLASPPVDGKANAARVT